MPISQKDLYYAIQQPARTNIQGSGMFGLVTGETRRFSTAGTTSMRRAAIITNKSTSNVDIVDSAGNLAAVVIAGTLFLLETDCDFILRNTSGPDIVASASVGICVLEYMLAGDIVRAGQSVASSGGGSISGGGSGQQTGVK